MSVRTPSSGDLKCDIPGCTTSKTFSIRGLGLHKRFEHGIEGARGNPRGPVPGGQFECDLCGHTASNPASLGLHKRVVHGIHGATRPGPDAPFECSACHRRFRNQHGLSLHISLMHKGKKALPLPASNGKPASAASAPSLDEAIAALEVKRDALQWVIEDLKRIALTQ